MSAFQVNLTPTRLKNNNKRNESREPTSVVMAPFSAKAIVTFEEVPVTKSAKRILKVFNPSEDAIKVLVTKSFPAELNISLGWTCSSIPAQSHLDMELVWNPTKEVACKQTLQLIDNRNFKKDVMVILKSVPVKSTKTTKRFPNVTSTTSHVKTLHLKSPTNPKPLTTSQRKRVPPQPAIAEKTEKITPKSKKPWSFSPLAEVNTKSLKVDSANQYMRSKEKENLSPLTPGSISALIDNIQFTPVADTRPKFSSGTTNVSDLDYLASLPTPNYKLHDGPDFQSLQPRRLSVLCSPDDDRSPAKRIPMQKVRIPEVIIEGEDDTAYSSLLNRVPINKTFDLKTDDDMWESMNSISEEELGRDLEIPDRLVLNKTTTLQPAVSRPLAMIEEEASPTSLYLKSSNMSSKEKDLRRDISLVGTPLRKYSESMRDLSLRSPKSFPIQGSMPNLNEMESIRSIEQNRYFHAPMSVSTKEFNNSDLSNASSTSSQHDLAFNTNEILAQSSRFNLHEIGKKPQRNSPTLSRAIKREITRTPTKKITPSKEFKSPSSSYAVTPKRFRENAGVDPNNSAMMLAVPKSEMMQVSPPKKLKIEADICPPLPNASFRSTKWARTQPKKPKMLKTLSLVRKPMTPRKIKEELRVTLYNSDLYLQHCINPDPFAASTTTDPFLASCMYLDERAVDKHEKEFKKWLNALVSMPADMDPDCSQKVDVGKLFNEVRNKDLILAPTKEEQSMNYLTKSRMDSLRRAAVELFISEQMRDPCSKVAVYINKGGIRIRSDRNLHLDVVMQREILELLMCFNPLWLRIGLEVVFSEIIHLHSNADVVGLSTFVLNRLVKDRFLEQKYSKAFTLSNEYAEHIKKFTLQKFLFLLLFLDKAKAKRIVKHNPCLFVKNSKYKDTKELLLRFSSQLLANVGDITKELKRFGYVLTHKQNFIDEFDYAFKNLAVDLRDGIRLTKVMEIILLREDLTQKLRVPAISRLQRIYNVNLGLSALAEADFSVKGEIMAKDIVEGHREKTLSLLWQIIYKFRAPKFHAAAKTIQKWWRDSWLKVCILRRIREKHEMRLNKAATVIQSVWRGYISRCATVTYRYERTNASICIQKYFRKYEAQRKFQITVASIIAIQRWYRASRLAIETQTQYNYFRKQVVAIQRWYRRVSLARKIEKVAPLIRCLKQEARLRHEKALVIQRYIKSYVLRKRLRNVVHEVVHRNRQSNIEHQSAAKIQSFFQMIKLRWQFRKKKDAVVSIERMWISYRLTVRQRQEFINLRQSVVKIQTFFRGYLQMKDERKKFLQLKASAQIVQVRFRANKLAAVERNEYLQTRDSIIAIQQRWRATLLMRRERNVYLNDKQIIISLQRRVRANLAMKQQRANFLRMKAAATSIQKYYRGRIITLQTVAEYASVKEKIIFIQRKWRDTLLARKLRVEFISLQYSAIVIQQHFRATRLMKEELTKFKVLRTATIYIQRKFRATLAMRATRKDFHLQLKAVQAIQDHFRAYKKMKFQRAKFNGTKQAVIYIQQRFRDYLQMKKDRNHFLKIRSATLVIQRHFRSYIFTKQVQSDYNTLKKAAVCIQRRYRALVQMRKQRAEYEQCRGIIIAMQRRYRAKLLGRQVRAEYERLKNAAICVQRKFRGRRLMKRMRDVYERQRQHIIVIQRYFRSYLLMKSQRGEFTKQKKSAIKIQTWYRSIISMRVQRNEYRVILQSVLVIQRRLRETIESRKVRCNYLDCMKAVCCIQQRFRAYMHMKEVRSEFLTLRNSAVAVQRRYRAKMVMLTIRSQYMLLRSLVVCIQSKFRANQQMKIERNSFLRLKFAAILIQQKYRGKMETRIQQQKYAHLKQATLDFQSCARGYLARKHYKEMLTPEMREFIKRKQAAKIIQRFWRGYRVRKKWQNLKIKTIRQNLHQMKSLNQAIHNTVRFKVQESCRILSGRFSVTDALHVLTRLDRMSRTVPHLLMDHSDFISTFCYGIMAQAIRSEVDKQLIGLCSRVILNLARYNSTTANTFQENGLVTIASMLLRWCDKDCDIFNTLCTLIWVFSHSSEKRKKIREFMTTPEAIYVVRETKKLVARKEKMKQNVRKLPTALQREQLSFMPRALPSLEPDFGVIRTKPYIFISSVYAFDTILCKLGIDIM